ncbi:hypothetical protein C6989_05445 [Nitrosopumilus sp. b2]|nr:hypothetical protein C6989_05445 [Nitrosopumilus sp. b2]
MRMASVFGSEGRKEEYAQEFVGEQKVTTQTGIAGFDEALGQGLPVGNLYLVSGQLGSSANLFVQQILYNNVISKQKVAYYTSTVPSQDIIQDMKFSNMDIQKFVDDGTWVFGRAIPSDKVEIVNALPENPLEQKIDLGDTLANLMNHLNETISDGRNTVIHLADLIRSYPMSEIQNTILYIESFARKYGGIHFVILTEDAHEKNDIMGIKDSADSVFEFTANIREETIENILTIQKVRDMNPRKRIIRLSQRNNGLSTETIRRIS